MMPPSSRMPAKRSGGRLGALSPSAAVRVFWMICRSCRSGCRSLRSTTLNHCASAGLRQHVDQDRAGTLSQRARELGEIVVRLVLPRQVGKVVDRHVELAVAAAEGFPARCRTLVSATSEAGLAIGSFAEPAMIQPPKLVESTAKAAMLRKCLFMSRYPARKFGGTCLVSRNGSVRSRCRIPVAVAGAAVAVAVMPFRCRRFHRR